MNSLITFASTAVLALSALAGCGADVGNGGTERTNAALVPSGTPLHRQDSRDFVVNGRSVRFSHVEYGQFQDCASGCFASHVCAVEDADSVSLYYAAWYATSERPNGLLGACPGAASDATNTHNCTTPGQRHALTATSEFQQFAQGQVGSGPFRFCF